jgi:hypothetical protein
LISPEEIRQRAERFYPQAIDAWLAGLCDQQFPWRVRSNRDLSDTHSDNIRDVHQLRQGAKESIGFGYTVQWESRKSRKHGDNDYFPAAIFIESFSDLLQLTDNLAAFKSLEKKVASIRQHLPSLETWLRQSWRQLASIDNKTVDELITVARYLVANPRPGCFPRELPLAVPTKLVQNQKGILSAWLDILLPDDAIDCSCNPRNFEQRYGFNFYEGHMLMRFLDKELQQEMNFPASELSLPPRLIRELRTDRVIVVMVENQVTLLTLPSMPRGIAFFGKGHGVTQLFHIPWISGSPIYYWGDLDVQGFEILGLLRRHYPQTISVLMDLQTVRAHEHLATAGTGHSPQVPTELNEVECEAFLYLRSKNLRIEQEHIMQAQVDLSFGWVVKGESKTRGAESVASNSIVESEDGKRL